ncbi:Uncharacterised protein [Raoultella terrigena]|uniref:Uncharacterized protein n=1 Tax=Raoultella terrigena TaxID=577 RepID=A0A4U9D8K6_RAOTE|nr:Uncharacterised protein [Raoultella terrigena]
MRGVIPHLIIYTLRTASHASNWRNSDPVIARDFNRLTGFDVAKRGALTP